MKHFLTRLNQSGVFVASGKFQHSERNVPYSAIVELFDNLIRQVLSVSSEVLTHFVKDIEMGVGVNLPLLTEFIPSLKTLIKSQPTFDESNKDVPIDRLRYALQSLIAVFSANRKSLVLFLDDIQWADFSSLKLVQDLLFDFRLKGILFIGAYRSNEVSESHPLERVRATIRRYGIRSQILELKPWSEIETFSFINKSFLQESEQSSLPVEWVYSKTGGNPYFIKLLLQQIKEGKITLNGVANRLNSKAENTDEIDTVSEIIQFDFCYFPPETRNAIELASCIGNRFRLDALAAILEKEIDDLQQILKPAVEHNFFTVRGKNYSFFHDKVREGVIVTIETGKRKQFHLLIGLYLIEQNSIDVKDSYLVANHLNQSDDLIKDQSLINRLAFINLQAGKSAKESGAFQSAELYLTKGIRLLPENGWKEQYHLAFELHIEIIETLYALSKIDKMFSYVESATYRAQSGGEKARISKVLIGYYGDQNEYSKATELGLQVLNSMGVTLPKNPTAFNLLLQLSFTLARFRKRGFKEILKTPMTDDRKTLDIVSVMYNLAPSAYNHSPNLFARIIISTVKLSLQKGHTPYSPNAYISFASILSGKLSWYKSAEFFSQLGLNLLKKSDNPNAAVNTNFMYGFLVNHWSHHLNGSLDYLSKSIRRGMELGEISTTGLAIAHYTNLSFFSLKSLTEVSQRFDKFENYFRQVRHENGYLFYRMQRQLVENVNACSPERVHLKGEYFDESRSEKLWLENHDLPILGMFYTLKTLLHFHFGNYEAANRYSKKADPYMPALTGQFTSAVHTFYQTLSIIKANRFHLTEEKGLKIIKRNLRKMKRWTDNCADNFKPLYLLMKAEYFKINGKPSKAVFCYSKSIQAAEESEFPIVQALGFDLAAGFYRERQAGVQAEWFTEKAADTYRRWGANTWADLLKPQETLVQMQATPEKNLFSSFLPTERIDGAGLIPNATYKDIMKMSRTTIEESDPDVNLKLLVKTALDVSEAEKAVFLSVEDDEMYIRAVGTKLPNEVLLQKTDYQNRSAVPVSLINYVSRMLETVTLEDISSLDQIVKDPYLKTHNPSSVLCLPIVFRKKLLGILYLEHKNLSQLFDDRKREVLFLITTHLSMVFAYDTGLQSLKKANHLKNRFLDDLSHKLRVPLNGISEITRSIIQNEKDVLSQEVREDLSLVVSNSRRASGLLEDTLELVKLENGSLTIEKTMVDIRSLCSAAVALVRPEAQQKGLEIKKLIDKPIPKIEGDENRLFKVLCILLENAVKVSSQGAIEILTLTEKDRIIITIRDSGTGIRKEERNDIFQRYQKGDRPGTVPELAKKVVELHGGEMWIGGEYGIDCEFSFSLPLGNGELNAAFSGALEDGSVENELNHDGFALRSDSVIRHHDFHDNGRTSILDKTILVVDDDPLSLKETIGWLLQRGFSVVPAMNGIDALDRVENTAPDLVVLDLIMPELDGFEVCRKIRSVYGKDALPVIILGADNRLRDVAEGLICGANDYLLKPFKKEELIARVTHCLEIKEAKARLKEIRTLEKEITFREIAEKDRERAMERFKSLLNLAAEAVVTISSDHRITFMNDRAKALFCKDGGYQGVLITRIIPSLNNETLIRLIEHQKNSHPGKGAKQGLSTIVSISDSPTGTLNILPIELQLEEEELSLIISPDRKQLEKYKGDAWTKVRHREHSNDERRDFCVLLVDLTNLCLEIWEQKTGKTKVDLAEESGIWSTYLDDDTYRTRTLEKYFQLDTIPQKRPQWQKVLKTADFIMKNCDLSDREETEIQRFQNEILDYERN